MSERKPLVVYECPFLMGTEGIICTTPVTEQQYHAYCREIPPTEKQPNHLQCPSYKRLMNSPLMTLKRIYAADMDIAHGQARKQGPDKV